MKKPVVHLKASDLRPHWTLPGAQTPGTARANYAPGAELTKTSARYIMIPRGQTTPPHHTTSEHIIVMFEGRVSFEFDSGDEYVIGPRDLLSFASGITYRYTNVGDGDAFFLSVQGCVDSWPPKTTYVDTMKPASQK